MAATGVARKTGKKQRKYDRNRKWCQSYRNRNQREKNKVKKVRRHLARFPNDKVAAKVIERGGRKLTP